MTGPERLSELRDVHLDSVSGGLGRFPGPESLDEPVDRDDPFQVERQHSEQGSRLRAAERNGPAVTRNLEGTEQAELELSFAPLARAAHITPRVLSATAKLRTARRASPFAASTRSPRLSAS